MSLIDTLKHDHEEILKLFEECRGLGITAEVRQKKLQRLRAVILAHLQREDAKLYPVLQKHEQTSELSRAYAAEMHGISGEVLQFFDSMGNGASGLEFARQFGRVTALLQQRMAREEVRLYPAFQQYCA